MGRVHSNRPMVAKQSRIGPLTTASMNSQAIPAIFVILGIARTAINNRTLTTIRRKA